MIFSYNRPAICALLTTLFLLLSNLALSSSPAPKKADPEAGEGEGLMVFKVTSPAARNSFPSEIIDRMRKELMVLMGVEPEETEDPEKTQNTGH